MSEDINEFVTILSPGLDVSVDRLREIIRANRDTIIRTVTQRGVLVFRGFTGIDSKTFNRLILDDLAFISNNAFNLKNVPGFMASWLRKYSESLVGGDYRRYLDRNTVRLGPAADSVQGPHTEGGVCSEKSRFIALCCLEPAEHLGETGICDFSDIWNKLPPAQKERYQTASNLYAYTTRRRIHWFDRLMLRYSPYTVSTLLSGKAELALPPCPFVVKHPETNQLCIQPWAFAKNTNGSVQRMAQATFQKRGPLTKDCTAEELNMNWRLCDSNGEIIKWDEKDHDEFFQLIFENAYLMQWEKGDVAIVDNVKCGHWRMNGKQGDRKIIQIQANHFNADDHRP
ncbi:hypothetical protein A9Q99_00045 [Gammaproteobacteria bacterium 45_16_T64]|nr:hypothetical protein A9Q99_00045 [Gammaproteobacteria bacterium 45_16_T64]